LTIFMNHEHHYRVCITGHTGQRQVELRRQVGDLQVCQSCQVAPSGPIELGFTADEVNYHFYFADESGHRTPLGDARIRYLSTEVAEGFTGVMLGLYATGNGRLSETPADFAWFDYSMQS